MDPANASFAQQALFRSISKHPIETNEEIPWSSMRSSWIEHSFLEIYEICFKAIYRLFHWSRDGESWSSTNDIFRGRPCSPALKQNSAAHLKTNFQVIPSIETNEKIQHAQVGSSNSFGNIYMHEIFLKAYIYSCRLFHWSRDGESLVIYQWHIPGPAM